MCRRISTNRFLTCLSRIQAEMWNERSVRLKALAVAEPSPLWRLDARVLRTTTNKLEKWAQ
jgi:hypothetical protein